VGGSAPSGENAPSQNQEKRTFYPGDIDTDELTAKLIYNAGGEDAILTLNVLVNLKESGRLEVLGKNSYEDPKFWMTPDGKMIYVDSEHRDSVYYALKDMGISTRQLATREADTHGYGRQSFHSDWVIVQHMLEAGYIRGQIWESVGSNTWNISANWFGKMNKKQREAYEDAISILDIDRVVFEHEDKGGYFVGSREASAREFGTEAGIVFRGGAGSGHHGHAGRPGEVGGSAPSGAGTNSKLIQRLPENVIAHLESFIHAVQTDLYKGNEHLMLFQANGTLLAEADGDKNGVRFEIKVGSMKDGFSIHNHPSGGSFSHTDVAELALSGADMGIVITKENVFLFKWKWIRNEYGRVANLSVAQSMVDDRTDKWNIQMARWEEEGIGKQEKVKKVSQFSRDLWREQHELYPEVFDYEQIPVEELMDG
jgi:hypothetical protein